ncbi:unnamed protein product, partial [Polarella glacialis]
WASAAATCERGGLWRLASSLLLSQKGAASSDARARSGSGEGGAGSCLVARSSAARACLGSGRWELALSVLAEPESAGRLDLVASNIALAACEMGGRWSLGICILQDLAACGLRPDATSLSASIGACGRARRWPQALLQLSRFPLGAMDEVLATVSMAAFVRASQWGRALDIFRLR